MKVLFLSFIADNSLFKFSWVELVSFKKVIVDICKFVEVNNGLLVVILFSLFSIKNMAKFQMFNLARSERLKETNSKGGMVKETGNTNKSLFALGKVISSLTDKKNANHT